MYKNVIRPILFALSQGDDELAHSLAIWSGKKLQRSSRLLRLVAWWCEAHKDQRSANVADIWFPNRIGLAAGLDKQAELIPLWQALGLGFVEIGSVLPGPQAGNERPRLFRLPKHEALFNRMGFNSDGVEQVARNFQSVPRPMRIPVGASLGKQKETPLEEAAGDYIVVLKKLGWRVSYFAMNVSSPNTPGLRLLQGRDYLEKLVHDVVEAESMRAAAENDLERPIFVKLAPDLTNEEFDTSLEALIRGGGRGLIISNTTTKQPSEITHAERSRLGEMGGFSGPFLFDRTVKRVRYARKQTSLPIIAVGGITHPQRVMVLRDAGADLFQILTGLVYQGPELVRRLRTAA